MYTLVVVVVVRVRVIIIAKLKRILQKSDEAAGGPFACAVLCTQVHSAVCDGNNSSAAEHRLCGRGDYAVICLQATGHQERTVFA